MAGEKSQIISNIVERLRMTLNEGVLTVQMKEANGELPALSQREYALYREILGSWQVQLEEIEDDNQ